VIRAYKNRLSPKHGRMGEIYFIGISYSQFFHQAERLSTKLLAVSEKSCTIVRHI
jgi:hypothetical protein